MNCKHLHMHQVLNTSNIARHGDTAVKLLLYSAIDLGSILTRGACLYGVCTFPPRGSLVSSRTSKAYRFVG